MVGSYVVAWEVRARRSAAVLAASRPRATSREHARFPGLQERVTKEVADLEAKRAKRFAGARA